MATDEKIFKLNYMLAVHTSTNMLYNKEIENVSMMANRKRKLNIDVQAETYLAKKIRYEAAAKFIQLVKAAGNVNVLSQNVAKISNNEQYKLLFAMLLKKEMDNFKTSTQNRKQVLSGIHGDNIRFLSCGQTLTNRQKVLRRHISTTLKTRGFCVLDKYMGHDIATSVVKEVVKLWTQNQFQKSSIFGENKLGSTIRSDEVCWVKGDEPNCKSIGSLLQLTDTVVASGEGAFEEYNIIGGTRVSKQMI